MVVEQERDGDKPIWSPAIGKALEVFGAAARRGVEDDVKRAAKDVVDATSAYFRLGGVPVFAHNPVPPQLIQDVLPVFHLMLGEPVKRAVDRFVGVFDESVRPLLIEQVRKQLQQAARAHTQQSDDAETDERGGLDREFFEQSLDAPSGVLDQPERSSAGVFDDLWAKHLVFGGSGEAASVESSHAAKARSPLDDILHAQQPTDRLSTSEPRRNGRQGPSRLKIDTLSSNNKGGGINSQRNFNLDQPSVREGYVIQEVTIVFRPRMPDGSLGSPRVLFHFWEGWRVDPGKSRPSEGLGPSNDSVRFQRGPGGGGRVEILTRTVFYEGLGVLPSGFRRNKKKGQPGFDPTIKPAGGLMATSQPFELRRGSFESMTNAENTAIYTDW
ncbi:MAG: hypothetical protein KBA31_19640 [Alphaproteobacteria bacterium]|nr:hypothetical protein [Alphaproteobacteria bacterium]